MYQNPSLLTSHPFPKTTAEAKHSLSVIGDSGRSYREALLPRRPRGAASAS
ncbi:unnamed protein product [Leuciscus chuanchicus]